MPVNRIAVAALALLAAAAARAQYSDTLYPANSQYATGNIHYDVWNELYVKADDDIHWHYQGMPFPDWHRGWARFDLSSVPDSAGIYEARFCYYVYDFVGDDMPTRHYVATLDPVTADSQALYDDLGQGILAGQDTIGHGWNEVDLDPDGVQAVADALARDWIAFGFVVPHAEFDTHARGWSSQQRPYLVINPGVTGCAEPGTAPPARPVLALSPNPAAGFTRLRCTLPTPGPARLRFFDTSGRAVLDRDLAAAGAGRAVRLDLTGLRSGVYLVRLDAGPRSASSRLVVR